ncbi:hypothetical protein Tco_0316048 [Tanacetum coccineum]
MWEDFEYQIDFWQSKLRWCEIMPYSIFTKLIINHFLSQHKSLAMLKHLYINTIKDDGVLNRLKFVRTGKGSQGKKAAVTPKKKSFISADDNIIPKQDVALELGKSMSLTEAEEEEVVKDACEAKDNAAIDWGSENKNDQDDDDNRSIDIKETNNDERTEDAFVHGDEYVHDDVDEEMKDAKTGKDDEEITDAKKTEATKGDYEQAGKLPPTSSNLSVSSDFGNQFLNLSSNISLICTNKESSDTKINSLLDIQIQQEVPQIQSPSLLKVPVLVILEQATPTPSPTLPTKTVVLTVPSPPPIVFAISYVQQQITPIPTPPITTVVPSVTTTVLDPLPTIVQKVSELEKDV